jgi:thimet oligopeptidase
MTQADGQPFDYGAVMPGDVDAGIDGAIVRAEALVDEVAAIALGAHSFANTMLALEAIDDVLGQASGRYGFLSQVSPDQATRETAHAAEERLSTFATGLGFREPLYLAVKEFAESEEGQALDALGARLVERTLRDFLRNGMDLDVERRSRLQELKERLVWVGIKFRRNVDEFDDAILITREELGGLPDSYIDSLRREEVDGDTRYRVSLDYPELFPFLESAKDADLRRALFQKNHNKAAVENVTLLEEAIAVRDEIATILGFASWAEYILQIRMAREPETVLDFLTDLEAKVRVKADRDIAELQESKQAETGGDESLAIWDWRYYQQRVLREKHDVDPFVVAEYFPLEATLEGLFDVYQRLVSVEFVARDSSQAWHPDVRFFDIIDRGQAAGVDRSSAADGGVVGHFYMDLHPRPDKFGHAAAFTLQSGRTLPNGEYQAPVSAIVANFTKPTAETPSLLRHSEVVTLFHEFGHILHQTLTRSRYLHFSGTRVERDFVEAPSQMLEHWCWQPEVLRGFSRHHESGERLPDDLLQRMIAAKNVGSGIAALRQIYFGRIDLAYHSAGREKDTDALARELHPITGFPFPEETHFQAGFGHLFGYDAGYYGYMWSKVYGDDMFTRFEQAGLDDPQVGRDYRSGILERGGTVDGDVLIREFLGREPRSEAFMRDLGLDP